MYTRPTSTIYILHVTLFTPSNKAGYYKNQPNKEARKKLIQISQIPPFSFAFVAWFAFFHTHKRKTHVMFSFLKLRFTIVKAFLLPAVDLTGAYSKVHHFL